MEFEIINNGIAFVYGDEPFMTDAQSALDFIATVRYETGCERIIINKSGLAEDFFRLGTGLAGEVLQKFVNYRMKLAVVGDFSKYSSKPLKDFIYECNRGRDFFFVTTKDEALEKLRMKG